MSVMDEDDYKQFEAAAELYIRSSPYLPMNEQTKHEAAESLRELWLKLWVLRRSGFRVD